MLKSRIRILAAAAGLAVTLLATLPSGAVADVMIMPLRVIFTDADRLKSLTVVNSSREAALFRVEFVNKRQLETGGYMDIEGPLNPDFDLAKMLVYSPRQVELPAQGRQSIRISLRRAPNMPDGEYRTHLHLARLSAPHIAARGAGARAVMGINIGFAMPVIVRKGKYDTTARISGYHYVAGQGAKEWGGRAQPAQLQVTLDRQGKYSALGKLEVFMTPPGGSERKIGELNSVNIFHETTRRLAAVNLTEPLSSGARVRVVFQGNDADKGIRFDERVFDMP